MSTYSRSPAGVRGWPADPAARKALQEYFAAPPRAENFPEPLGGGNLDFSGADLSGLDLSGAWFGEAVLSGVRMTDCDLFTAWLVQAVLRGTDMSRCNLRKADGRACDARGVIFRGAELERADFEDSDFREADMSGAHFGRGSLAGADLRGADLSDCVFGSGAASTTLLEARLAGCRVAGSTGSIDGPVDIGADSPHLIDGDELRAWFASQGAPLVEVTTPWSLPAGTSRSCGASARDGGVVCNPRPGAFWRARQDSNPRPAA